MPTVNKSPLWALISEAMTKHELSYRQVQDRSNGAVTRGDLGFWKNGTTKHISPAKLVAVAGALDLDLAAVVDAALATFNLPSGTSIEAAIRADSELPELTKRQLLRMVSEARQAAPTPRARKVARPRHQKPEPGQQLS